MAKRATKKTAAATLPVSAGGFSYLEWGPVLGGAALAMAISVVLFQFGATVGLAVDAPLRGEGGNASLGVIASGIWLLWVPLISSMAGGYLAGVMRGRWADATDHEAEMRDGAHGLTVWAIATLGAAAGAALLAAIAAIGADEAAATAQISEAAMESARKMGVVFGFINAAAAALGAGVAWWAATVGGEHRDEGIDVNQFVPGFLRD